MLVAVADTHAVIWYIFANPKLSPIAKAFIDGANDAGDQVGVSSITLIEMVYLIEKGRVAAESFTRLATIVNEAGGLFREIVPDLPVARELMRVDVTRIPDMPDRILVSKDSKIRLSGIATLW